MFATYRGKAVTVLHYIRDHKLEWRALVVGEDGEAFDARVKELRFFEDKKSLQASLKESKTTSERKYQNDESSAI